MPATGKRGKIEQNRMMSMMPVQKTGAENPMRANMVTPWLSRPFGRRAAMTPRTVPSMIASTCALKTRSRVAGRRSRSSSVTG